MASVTDLVGDLDCRTPSDARIEARVAEDVPAMVDDAGKVESQQPNPNPALRHPRIFERHAQTLGRRPCASPAASRGNDLQAGVYDHFSEIADWSSARMSGSVGPDRVTDPVPAWDS